MSKLFVCSDYHLSHVNVLKYCNRPFATVEEMNEALLHNANELVGEKDRLYFLGDFAFGENKRATIANFLQRLRCKQVFWVMGNHDKYKDGVSLKEAGLISWCGDILYTREAGIHITMCHYAWRTWPEQGRGGWNLFGHSHGSLNDDPTTLGLDVGVDTELFGHRRFYPYSFDEIRDIFATHKRPRAVDHHDGLTSAR